MAFSTAGSGPSKADINITPMIDVLLVLIIIFMVAVSSIQKKGLATQVPQPADGPNSQVQRIVIEVGAAADQQLPPLRINDEKVTWGGLQNRLVDIFKRRAERVRLFREMTALTISTLRMRFPSPAVQEWRGLVCCRGAGPQTASALR